MAKTLHALTDFVDPIAKSSGLKKYQVKRAMVAFIEQALIEISNGNEVHLSGLGRFFARTKKDATIYCVETGKHRKLDYKITPTFRFSAKAAGRIKRGVREKITT